MSQHHAATAPTDCTVVVINVSPGDSVRAGAIVAIVEMMKIEHLVTSPVDGKVGSIVVQLGDVLTKGQTSCGADMAAMAGPAGGFLQDSFFEQSGLAQICAGRARP